MRVIAVVSFASLRPPTSGAMPVWRPALLRRARALHLRHQPGDQRLAVRQPRGQLVPDARFHGGSERRQVRARDLDVVRAHLLQGVGLHLARDLALVGERVSHGAVDGLPDVPGKRPIERLVHQQRDRVVGDGGEAVEPGHLVKPAAHESDGVRLPAVDHALLERGVDLAVVHRRRLDAQRGIGRQVGRVLQDPELEAGEILGRLDGSPLVVDVAEPVVEETERADSGALEEEIAPPSLPWGRSSPRARGPGSRRGTGGRTSALRAPSPKAPGCP